jgi:hypothetical protein
MCYTGHDDRGRYGLMHASAPAPAGPWTKHGSTFIFYPGDVFPCEVWRENGVYHMLYMRSDQDFREILLATSLDGVAWFHRGSVFEAAGGDAWDNGSVRWPTQMAVGTAWYTFYQATGRTSGEAIGLATSRDRYGFLSGGAGAPGPPLRPAVSVSGNRVRVSWSSPVSGDAVHEYLVSAGPEFGSERHGAFRVAAGSHELAGEAPDGLHFVRVAGRNASGTGPPSHDVWFQVGVCESPPDAPVDPTAASTTDPNGVMTVRLTWQPRLTGCLPTAWIIDIGRAPGTSDVATVETPATQASFVGQGPAGPYHARVRGRNAAGFGASSDVVSLAPRP